MKKFLVPAMLACCVSCYSTADKLTIDAVNVMWSDIGPRYREYVKDDVSLDDGKKSVHLRSAELMDIALSDALKRRN